MLTDRLSDLPLDPEDWAGSDEWAELADARQRIIEQMKEHYQGDLE